MLIGHTQQFEELERAAWGVCLLLGPSGIGKWLVAASYADSMGVQALELREGPTAEDARQVVQLYRQRPLGGTSVITIIDLDECSEQVQNILLKTLEELPEWGEVLLVASDRPYGTILSRVNHTIHFDRLTDEQVQDILIKQGLMTSVAVYLAKLAGGSVGRALAIQKSVTQKPIVMQLLDAMARHDRVALTTLLDRWRPEATALLWRWITEVLDDWPRAFTRDELAVVHKIGKSKFGVLVNEMMEGHSPEVAIMEVWKR